jgi:plasmid stability protein
MNVVPTLHLRNVPVELYERLRRRAKQNGRSMNAEAVALLEEVVDRKDRTGTITDELRRLAYQINLPEDAPKPEELIREIRDAPPRGL